MLKITAEISDKIYIFISKDLPDSCFKVSNTRFFKISSIFFRDSLKSFFGKSTIGSCKKSTTKNSPNICPMVPRMVLLKVFQDYLRNFFKSYPRNASFRLFSFPSISSEDSSANSGQNTFKYVCQDSSKNAFRNYSEDFFKNVSRVSPEVNPRVQMNCFFFKNSPKTSFINFFEYYIEDALIISSKKSFKHSLRSSSEKFVQVFQINYSEMFTRIVPATPLGISLKMYAKILPCFSPDLSHNIFPKNQKTTSRNSAEVPSIFFF